MSVGSYRPAAVCKRGHVETSDLITLNPPSPRCEECRARVLTACQACNARIRGRYFVPGVIGISNYEKPNFCDSCGAAFPWVGRKARIYELQDRLDDEELDSPTEQLVREQLEALTNPDLDELQQVKRWQRIKNAAPDLLLKAATSPIVTSLVAADAKEQLGLPPG